MRASDLAGLIPECCSEVLDAMYFTTLLGSVPLDTVPECLPDADATHAFSLSFVGDISGRFGLHLEQPTARTLAANFLGEADAGVSSAEVSEVVGELANMLCGSLMSRVEGEHSFALSHPESGLLARSDDCDLIVSLLETDSGIITIWILIERSPCRS
jgi:CheY-specific phosphatase CheX